MMRLRMLTAGESHGPGLTVIVDGLPAGLALSADEHINPFLHERQQGHGRGGRMQIERDVVHISGGVRHGRTIGAPVAMTLINRDFENWKEAMSVGPTCRRADVPTCDELRVTNHELPTTNHELRATSNEQRATIHESRDARRETRDVSCPRPGHADLAGGLKFNTHDLRNVLERASARETAARVAAGSVARRLLAEFGIVLRSHVVQIGDVHCADVPMCRCADVKANPSFSVKKTSARRHIGPSAQISAAWWQCVAQSPVRCGDPATTEQMISAIDAAARAKETLGGIFEVEASGVPPGLGSYAQWNLRLDGQIAQAFVSIPGVKGVEFGLGFAMAELPGSRVHDEIVARRASRVAREESISPDDLRETRDARRATQFSRPTNHAGGIEGGISNGESILVRAIMKPLATLMQPLASVDVRTKESARAHLERSDVCVVPAAACIGEAMLAWVLADALLIKLGGDSMDEMRRNFGGYCRQLMEY